MDNSIGYDVTSPKFFAMGRDVVGLGVLNKIKYIYITTLTGISDGRRNKINFAPGPEIRKSPNTKIFFGVKSDPRTI